MPDLKVPKLNNNDDSYVILEWFADDGAEVTADEPLVLLETSKAVEEITAPHSGALRVLRPASSECSPGEVIATIAGGSSVAESPAIAASGESEPTLTQAARTYAIAHAITAEQIAGLGRRVVRVQDLTKLTETAPTAGRSQAGVASTVTEAAQIPAAYSLMHLDAAPFRDFTAQLIEAGRRVPAPLELILKIVAGLTERHPVLFVAPTTAGADAIGVTVDAGNGLYVPVVRDAGSAELAEIGEQLAVFGRAARTAGFTGKQLSGARISISVTAYADVAFTVPLVFPGQLGMLSLGMLTSKVVLDGAQPVAKALLPLGITYDHRTVNGRDAVLFLRAIGRRFADRDWLHGLADQQPLTTGSAGRR